MLLNWPIFNVSGENIVKCLEGFFIVFEQFVFALGKSVIKSLMNFAPVLKGLLQVSFFDRTVFWEAQGSTGTNLVSTTCDQNIMAASKGFPLGVVGVVEHKATKSGHKLPNRGKKGAKNDF